MNLSFLIYLPRFCVKGVFIAFISMFTASHANAASYDCNKAKHVTEQQICAHLNLNDADVKMATSYQIIQKLVPMGTRGAIQDEQVQWRKQRNLCRVKIECIEKSYQIRQLELDLHLQRVIEQGPF